MPEQKRIQLPPSPLGDDRWAEMAYTFHGDVLFRFWPTDPDQSSPPPEETRVFGMAHGNEVTVIACMIGFYRRMGSDEKLVKEAFTEVASGVLADPGLAEYPIDADRWQVRGWSWTLAGSNTPRHDLPDRGLECLQPPVPIHPGVVAKSGGTGIYTRQVGSELRFVFSHQPASRETATSPDHPPLETELCPVDILPLAQVVCDLSMGEYRRDIRDLVATL